MTPAVARLRRSKARLARWLAVASCAVLVWPLVDITIRVTVLALPALRPQLLWESTTGIAGGLANALWGTLVLVAAAAVVVLPVGILAGLYLVEFPGRLVSLVRTGTSVLTGVPSIVVGYVGYLTMVTALGWGFSLAAGAVALAVIMLPYVVRTTEVALLRVPASWREASLSLGASRTTTALRVSLRGALPGIITGSLLALGIGLGETAPLLYTAGWSNYMPAAALTHSPVGYLTYVVWTYINEPFTQAHQLAYAAAFLLMLLVLGTNIVARLTVGRTALRS